MRAVIMVAALAACAPSTPTTHHLKYSGTDRPRWDYEMRDGQVEGPSRTYHYNGTLASTGTYSGGVKHGVFRYFDEDERPSGQALFINGEQRWSSADSAAVPPDPVQLDLDASVPGRKPVDTGPPLISMEAPDPLFTTLDRTTPLTRGGLLIGVVGVGEDSVVRSEVFAHVPIGPWGVYAQVATATLLRQSAQNLSGRRTLDVGGTRALAINADTTLSLRAGVLAPVGNDDAMGLAASSAATPLRLTDGAASMPSTVTARTSGTISARYSRLVLQADGGIDWAMGGPDSTLEPLARLNVAAGFGVQSVVLNLELSNIMRVRDPGDRLHAFAVGTTLWLRGAYLNSALSVSTDSTTGIHLGGGFAF